MAALRSGVADLSCCWKDTTDERLQVLSSVRTAHLERNAGVLAASTERAVDEDLGGACQQKEEQARAALTSGGT
jgi:hypothetical protein